LSFFSPPSCAWPADGSTAAKATATNSHLPMQTDLDTLRISISRFRGGCRALRE